MIALTTNTPGIGSISLSSNNPPNVPAIPSGPASGFAGVYYTYSTHACDPDGDRVFYTLFWNFTDTSGNPAKTDTQFTDAFDPCGVRSANNKWDLAGKYNVTAQATDVNGASSDRSSPLPVTIGKVPCGRLQTDRTAYNVSDSVLITFKNDCSFDLKLISSGPWSVWQVLKDDPNKPIDPRFCTGGVLLTGLSQTTRRRCRSLQQ